MRPLFPRPSDNGELAWGSERGCTRGGGPAATQYWNVVNNQPGRTFQKLVENPTLSRFLCQQKSTERSHQTTALAFRAAICGQLCVPVCMFLSFLFTLVISPSHMNLQEERVKALERQSSYVTFSRGLSQPAHTHTHTHTDFSSTWEAAGYSSKLNEFLGS